MSAELIGAVAGVSTVFGLLALIAYFFLNFRLAALKAEAQRSVRSAVEGQGIFNASQVVEILKTFGTDETRLAALKELAKSQKATEKSAEIVYEQIKSSTHLVDLSDERSAKYKRVTSGTASVFVILATLATGYGTLTNSEFLSALLGLFGADHAPQPAPKVFALADIQTRQGDGKSGELRDVRVTLLPPDDQHPNGRFIATWKYATGSGTWKGSQAVTIRMKGEGGADLPSPKAIGLDRSKCHYGEGDPQTTEGDLQTPFNSIVNVDVIPNIASGHTGPC